MSETLFDVYSPDNFVIDPLEIYSNEKAALAAFKRWKERYKHQGYYSSTRYGRIKLNELLSYCTIVEMPYDKGQIDNLRNSGINII